MYLYIQTRLFGEKKCIKVQLFFYYYISTTTRYIACGGALLLAAYWSGKDQNITTVPKIIKLFVGPYNYQYPATFYGAYTQHV